MKGTGKTIFEMVRGMRGTLMATGIEAILKKEKLME